MSVSACGLAAIWARRSPRTEYSAADARHEPVGRARHSHPARRPSFATAVLFLQPRMVLVRSRTVPWNPPPGGLIRTEASLARIDHYTARGGPMRSRLLVT